MMQSASEMSYAAAKDTYVRASQELYEALTRPGLPDDARRTEIDQALALYLLREREMDAADAARVPYGW